jgi:secreted trypsin-like serine protease
MKLSILGLVSALSATPRQDNQITPRIVGGVQSQPFSYPIVALYKKGGFFCGGTLISRDTVVTAAHCTYGDDNIYTVSVHRHNLTLTPEAEGGKIFGVKSRIVHPDYDYRDLKNDIAIWKLNVTESDHIEVKEVLFDDGKYATTVGTPLTAAGWGLKTEDGPASDVLLEITLPLMNMDECVQIYKDVFTDIYPAVSFCIGFKGNGDKDTCSGDSGGPLFARNEDNQLVLTGITSWGLGCGYPYLPGVS